MRLKDLEQAILLEEKVALQATYLAEAYGNAAAAASGTTSTTQSNSELTTDGSTASTSLQTLSTTTAETFLAGFGSYKELVTDDCDTVEITKRVFVTVQEISQLASNLYKSATGSELPMRSFSSVGERQSDVYQSPKLPTRAETFGGFDERKAKPILPPPWRDAVISTINNTISIHNNNKQDNHHRSDGKRDSYSSETESSAAMLQQSQNYSGGGRLSQEHLDALQVSHHLHTMLCIVNQQMTTIASLHAQVNAIRDNPKTMYRHNDQLEELRNLQDKIQEEKTTWMKQKEMQEKELDERRAEQLALQKQIRTEQEDIRQQREQLFRKMEKLTSQGVILSPNVSIPNISGAAAAAAAVSTSPSTSVVDDLQHGGGSDENFVDGGNTSTGDRRKDKWRSSSSKCSQFNLFLEKK